MMFPYKRQKIEGLPDRPVREPGLGNDPAVHKLSTIRSQQEKYSVDTIATPRKVSNSRG